MQSDALLEKIALFYQFTFLDEPQARQATARALRMLDRQPQGALTSVATQATLVRLLQKNMNKSRKSLRPSTLTFSAGPLILPDKVNLGPWFEFRKNSDEREFNMVIFSKILKFSNEAIAQGLDLPVGTVRYRVGHGLKILGRILKAGESNA